MGAKLLGVIRRRGKGYLVAVVLGVAAIAVAGCEGKEEREAKYQARGKELYEQGNFVKAALEFRSALQIDPADVQSQFYLGLIAEKTGDPTSALGAFQRISELDPKHVPARIKLGQYALLQDSAKNALERADQALAIDPENADAHALRAAVLLRQTRYEEASVSAARALSTDPKNAAAFSVLAGIQVRLGHPDQALKLLDDGLKSNPNDEGLRVVKLKILSDKKDAAGIETTLSELIRIAPDNNKYKVELAKFLVLQGRSDDAEKFFRDTIRTNPQSKDLHLLFVQFLGEIRGLDAAQGELAAISAQNPDEYAYKFALAELYVQQGQSDQARMVLNDIVTTQADSPQALTAKAALARIDISKGDIDGAKALIEDVLKVDAANEEALLLKAGLALDGADYQSAIADLRSVLRDHPTSKQALLLLARAYAGSNEEELTAETYRKYLELGPENDDVRVEFARRLMQSRKLAEAEEQIDLALKHTPKHVQALLVRVDQRIARQSWVAAEAAARWIISDADAPVAGKTALGKVMLAQQKFAEAIPFLKQAADEKLGPSEARSLLVEALAKGGKSREAAALLHRAIEQNPADTDALLLLADLSFNLGDNLEAEKALKTAIGVAPNWRLAYLKLGDFYQRIDKSEGAVETYYEGLQKLPDDVEMRLRLAIAEDSRNNFERAREAYELVLRQQPRNWIAANNLAALIADAWPQDKDRLEQARRLSEPFRNLEDGTLLDTLGWVQYRLGNVDDAIGLLERAAKVLPEQGQLRYHLGMAYKARGDLVKARSELELAVNGRGNFRGVSEAQRALAEY